MHRLVDEAERLVHEAHRLLEPWVHYVARWILAQIAVGVWFVDDLREDPRAAGRRFIGLPAFFLLLTLCRPSCDGETW